MVRTNKMKQTFDTRFQKALQQANARRQRKVRERQDRIEEVREDAEFDRIHRVKELAAKAKDPIASGLKRLDRLAVQLTQDPEMQAELVAQEAVATHHQGLSDVQQAYANACALRAEEIAQARNEVAAKYQAWRY